MNVETGTEAAQFPEKEYIMGFLLQCSGEKVGNFLVQMIFTLRRFK
jgi:hypothetical protein